MIRVVVAVGYGHGFGARLPNHPHAPSPRRVVGTAGFDPETGRLQVRCAGIVVSADRQEPAARPRELFHLAGEPRFGAEAEIAVVVEVARRQHGVETVLDGVVDGVLEGLAGGGAQPLAGLGTATEARFEVEVREVQKAEGHDARMVPQRCCASTKACRWLASAAQ